MKLKKQKAQKVYTKRKLKFEDYEHWLEASPLENKINQLAKNKINVNSLTENHKEFIKKPAIN